MFFSCLIAYSEYSPRCTNKDTETVVDESRSLFCGNIPGFSEGKGNSQFGKKFSIGGSFILQ